jgi:hypothetical protein
MAGWFATDMTKRELILQLDQNDCPDDTEVVNERMQPIYSVIETNPNPPYKIMLLPDRTKANEHRS